MIGALKGCYPFLGLRAATPLATPKTGIQQQLLSAPLMIIRLSFAYGWISMRRVL
jgi:hypothetical protein